ncbi:MAG: trypsin-like peptidase domain-containing protein [Ruminococcus sp.]|nr:trypsin-like peptidase domain-containing protein [Ruminococcus sp.]
MSFSQEHIGEQEDVSKETQAEQATDQTPEEDSFEMPEGAVDQSEIVDKDFWKGITLPQIAPKPKKKGSVLFSVVFSLVFIAAGFGIACVTARGQGVLANLVTGGKHMTFSLPVSKRPDSTNSVQKDEEGRYTAEGIAEVCGGSVVSIDIYTSKSAYIPAGQGSGIILSADGYIVSNAHVVNKAENGIKVALNDGSEYAAQVIGVDTNTDIAVIKIPAKDLTPAEFCDSDDVKLGEEVVAIGNPAGYRNSITKGIVSGLDRRVLSEDSMSTINCIQVDAAVNPGNSGGALFNMWGQVIGITSSKLASVDYEGIGFAIATNDAKAVIEQLMESGETQGRAKMGITFVPVSKQSAQMNGVKEGMCVVEINEDCDIHNTELASGDIITEVNGKAVSEYEDVPEYIRKLEPGTEISCHIYRPKTETEAAKEFDIKFKLEEDKGSLVEKKE